jgi:hypothetical protein
MVKFIHCYTPRAFDTAFAKLHTSNRFENEVFGRTNGRTEKHDTHFTFLFMEYGSLQTTNNKIKTEVDKLCTIEASGKYVSHWDAQT